MKLLRIRVKKFNNEEMGNPRKMADGLEDALREKGLIQEQAPLPGRFEEIVQIAEQHGRDPGMLYFPAAEIRRLMADDDWDFGPRGHRYGSSRSGNAAFDDDPLVLFGEFALGHFFSP